MYLSRTDTELIDGAKNDLDQKVYLVLSITNISDKDFLNIVLITVFNVVIWKSKIIKHWKNFQQLAFKWRACSYLSAFEYANIK